jgi:hypothetical protein
MEGGVAMAAMMTAAVLQRANILTMEERLPGQEVRLLGDNSQTPTR